MYLHLYTYIQINIYITPMFFHLEKNMIIIKFNSIPDKIFLQKRQV